MPAAGYVGQYIHMGGKIGVQVEFGGVDAGRRGARRVRDAGQGNRDADRRGQPGATSSRDAVPADVLDKEKAIYRAQMENSGKPAERHRQDRRGQARSFYAQVVLPDQPSIRDPKMTVADVIAAANKALGAPSTVTRFARLKVGEAPADAGRVACGSGSGSRSMPALRMLSLRADCERRTIYNPLPVTAALAPPTSASSSSSPAKP